LQVHINDLSLAGQYTDPQHFRSALEPLLEFRVNNPHLKQALYCSRSFSVLRATHAHSVQEAVLGTRDRNYIGLVLSWLSKSGPFWDDERFGNADDFFRFGQVDVTDQGLGEAARRLLSGVQAGTYSFLDTANTFGATPLRVDHGLEEEPLGAVDVVNFWTMASLEPALLPIPASWKEVMEGAQPRFVELMFHRDILKTLEQTPFDRGIADRIVDVLTVLQTLARETNIDGSFTASGLELWQKHSVGEKAWITDESESNKRDFRNELEFVDPRDPQVILFCPWHGKVKKGQFRIHFEWPRPRNQKHIKVVYIGPKITKH